MEIKIKYFADIEPIRFIAGKSDWYDLRAAEDVEMKAGEYRLIKLGVGMQLPKGYEAHMAPRSGTFKNYGIIHKIVKINFFILVSKFSLPLGSYVTGNKYRKCGVVRLSDNRHLAWPEHK